ncbi:hypothetical protein BDV95DRAFT_158728 [Massariosphaeria phaeospora]|uniref:Uncharacterized protein n=1 Tax=Massariosphaeria phaeospora TaxID=100035 RepID=A0A7C8I1B0_9PLEO|nr:hypothetical protein BDV95DRAFT_158728 [Massariosphaeria phaeospora]
MLSPHALVLSLQPCAAARDIVLRSLVPLRLPPTLHAPLPTRRRSPLAAVALLWVLSHSQPHRPREPLLPIQLFPLSSFLCPSPLHTTQRTR